MKYCIIPTCLWFIPSNESIKVAMYLAVVVPRVQSTVSTQPFRNSSNKSKSVPDTVLCISISEYLIPLSRIYRALFHKWSHWKSSDMLHTTNRQLRVWAGSDIPNMLRQMNTTLFTYRKRQHLVSWVAPRTLLIALPRSPLSKEGV